MKNLDLFTLKQIKSAFQIFSDHSTTCQGYDMICRQVEKLEKLESEVLEDIELNKQN